MALRCAPCWASISRCHYMITFPQIQQRFLSTRFSYLSSLARKGERRWSASPVPGQCNRNSSTASAPSPSMIQVKTSPLPSLPTGHGTQASITICNPRKLNIANAQTLAELTRTFQSMKQDPNLRIVVLTGQSDPSHTPAFCGGADIRQMGAISNSIEAKAFITQIYDLCEAIRNLDAITIARIDGVCLGAGLEVAASCDFRYATAGSKFGMPEVAIGIPSVVHARLLANIVGWQRAKRLVTFANVFDGREADEMGLLDLMAESPKELDSKLEKDIGTLGGHGMKALQSQKRLVRVWEDQDLETGLRAGIDSFAEMYDDGGSEPRHFMAAWAEKMKKKAG